MNLMGLLGQQGQQQGGLGGLLSDPAMMAGMGLLSAGYDSRINPYQSALQGLAGAQQYKLLEQKRKREEEQYERQEKAIEQFQKITGNMQQQVPMGPPTPGGQMNMQPQPDPMAGMMGALAESGDLGAAANLYGNTMNRMREQEQMQRRAPIGVPRVMAGQDNQYRMVQPIWDPETETVVQQDIGPAPAEPPAGITQQMLSDQTAYREANLAATEAGSLADQFEQNQDRLSAGVAGSTEDYFKQLFGTEDYLSELRRRQREVQVKAFVANLPPGIASDKDVEIARDPIPKDFANPSQVSGYLRSIEKGNRKMAEFLRFRENYLTQNRYNPGGLLNAWDEHKKNLSWWTEGNYPDAGKSAGGNRHSAESSDGWRIVP